MSASDPSDHNKLQHAGSKRKRTINALAACNSCRKRKSRCNGARPSCDACKRRGQVCEYDVEPGFRKRESERRKLDHLRAEHKDLQDVMRQIRDGSPDKVEAILRRLRDGEIDGIEAVAMSKRSKSYSTENSSDSSAGDIEKRADSFDSTDPGFSPPTRSPNFSFTKHVSPSAHGNFLNRHLFEVAVAAYHKSIGDLFHTYTSKQASSLLDAVFVPNHKVLPSSALTQLCGMAAVGSMYCQGSLPETATEYLYTTARNNLESLIAEDTLSAIKVALMLALCNVVYKSLAAMSYLNLGLLMSRVKSFRPKPTDIDASQWSDHKRVWRTLVLCNGWMVSTTGLAAKISWEESHDILHSLSLEPDIPLRDVIQLQMAKIATLKANILSTLCNIEEIEPAIFVEARNSLQQWSEELPHVMSLSSLLNNNIADKTYRTKILYAHLVYLGSLMLLPRCLARRWMEGSANTTELSSKEALSGIDEGFIAAQQSARVLGLLRAEDEVIRQSWLFTHESYNSSLMSMFKYCQGLLLYGSEYNEKKTLFEFAERSLDCLHYSTAEDHTADVLYSQLQPHVAVIKSTQQQTNAVIKSKPQQTDDAQLTETSQGHLQHPFYIPPGDTGLHHTTRALLDLISEFSDSIPQLNGSVTAERTKSLLDEDVAHQHDRDWEVVTPPAENPSKSWVKSLSSPREQPRVLFPFSSLLEPQMATASSVQPSEWVEAEIGGRGAEPVASRLRGAQ